jgi:hypothetical protein
VPLAGVDHQIDLDCLKLKKLVVDVQGEFASPETMLGIVAIVLATTVVQQRESLDDTRVRSGYERELQSVVPNSCPVRRSVNATPVKGEARSEEAQEGRSVHEA